MTEHEAWNKVAASIRFYLRTGKRVGFGWNQKCSVFGIDLGIYHLYLAKKIGIRIFWRMLDRLSKSALTKMYMTVPVKGASQGSWWPQSSSGMKARLKVCELLAKRPPQRKEVSRIKVRTRKRGRK